MITLKHQQKKCINAYCKTFLLYEQMHTQMSVIHIVLVLFNTDITSKITHTHTHPCKTSETSYSLV